MTSVTRTAPPVLAARAGLRWGLSFLCVLVLHSAVAAVWLMRPPPVTPDETPAGAMFIELAPLPTAPRAPREEISPAPVSSPAPVPDMPPLTEPAPESRPVAEKETEPAPEPTPEPEADPSPPALVAEAEPPAEIPPLPPRRPVRRSQEPIKAGEKRVEGERRHAAPASPPAAAKTKGREAAPETSGAIANDTRRAMSAWQQQVMRRLASHKRYPRLAKSRRETGVAQIRFVMDSRGHVQSVHLVRGTGHALLDKEALALPRRASPLPAPPKHIQRRGMELVVPVRFSIR